MAVLGVDCEPLSGWEFPGNREFYRENSIYFSDVPTADGRKIVCLESLPALRRFRPRNLTGNVTEPKREHNPRKQGRLYEMATTDSFVGVRNYRTPTAQSELAFRRFRRLGFTALNLRPPGPEPDSGEFLKPHQLRRMQPI